MKIEIIDEIEMGLRKALNGRVRKRMRLKPGDSYVVEFLGEHPDLETISFQFADGFFALDVPRCAIAVTAPATR